MSLYLPVKYALLIILTLGIVVTILNLIPELQHSGRYNTNRVVIFIAGIIVMFVGLIGSHRNNRQLLLTFAIVCAVGVIISVAQSQATVIIGNAVLEILSIILAVYQSEMIRTGDM